MLGQTLTRYHFNAALLILFNTLVPRGIDNPTVTTKSFILHKDSNDFRSIRFDY